MSDIAEWLGDPGAEEDPDADDPVLTARDMDSDMDEARASEVGVPGVELELSNRL